MTTPGSELRPPKFKCSECNFVLTDGILETVNTDANLVRCPWCKRIVRKS
jgi:predicted  nucleic acid-binding Zn-ribbon protein